MDPSNTDLSRARRITRGIVSVLIEEARDGITHVKHTAAREAITHAIADAQAYGEFKTSDYLIRFRDKHYPYTESR